MVFDKCQKNFPSDFHREVWWWAVGLVPPEDSLTEEVKRQCGADVLAGCYQWYDYFLALCEDMYINTDFYQPASPRQYRDLLERIAAEGRPEGDLLIWDEEPWLRYTARSNKSKAYAEAGITLESNMLALRRTGLESNYADGKVIFINAGFPKIFHAMHTFEKSPNVKKTPARRHFAHCEFRQLFKSYSADYNELLRRVSGESLSIAHAIHEHAKTIKIQRYVHFDTIKYKYKNIRVLDFTVTGHEYPTLRVNIGAGIGPSDEKIRINPFKEDLDKIREWIDIRKKAIDEYVQ